jgi:hypothetical protein
MEHSQSDNNGTCEKQEIPEEFEKIISECIFALLEVCPEYNNNINEDLKSIIVGTPTESNIKSLYDYCCKIYPINIFNIMGKSEELFENDENDTHFLPGIDFKNIWKDDSISDTTKETIWKYLQLILFTIVGNISDMDSFGESAKLFEMIDEDELKDKLQDTFENMEKMFSEAEASEKNDSNSDTDQGPSSTNKQPFNMPDVNNMHDHIKGLMGGKLGNLAAEIAEETAQELNINENDHGSVKDVFQSMMKNPTKLMGIANKIGSKLETKMKSGELDEKELMKEAAEMFSKMKNTPGMGDIEKMMRSMGGMGGMGGRGGKGKVDMNAMQQHFDRQTKIAGMKERADKKANERREQYRKDEEHRIWAEQQPNTIDPSLLKELGLDENDFIYTNGEKPERTPRPNAGDGNSKKSKSGGKKKKKKGKK